MSKLPPCDVIDFVSSGRRGVRVHLANPLRSRQSATVGFSRMRPDVTYTPLTYAPLTYAPLTHK